MEDPQTPEELARIHEQLWQTVLQFGNFSASQERNRIARDLHDSLGQALTALNIQLQTAVKLWQLDPGRAEQFLEEAQRLGSTAVQEVRQTVRTLRMDCPDDQSLDTLIASLVESFHRSTGVLPTVKLNLLAPVPPEVVTPVYRIIQEGLNNICKYAQATEVNLQLSTTPTSLGLIIEDNGRGFDLEHAVTGFGLRGMQERVSLLRGRFQIETEPGTGCRIRVVMPLRVLSLQETQGLVPPPPTPEAGASRYPQGVAPPSPQADAPPPPVTAAPPSATLAEGNGRVEIGEPQPDQVQGNGRVEVGEPQPQEQDLTHRGENDLENAPDSLLPLIGEPDTIAPSSPPEAALDDPDVTTLPGLVLTLDQHDRLTQILLEWVGPIAPILLQRAITQAQQPADLIDQLAAHFPAQRRGQFEQQVQAVFAHSVSTPPSNSGAVVDVSSTLEETSLFSAPQLSNEYFLALSTESIHYCEQELTALIGPVAHFLIQEALSTPSQSLEELVDRLVANIPNPQKAAQFKQRILAYAS